VFAVVGHQQVAAEEGAHADDEHGGEPAHAEKGTYT
jgi:hypothetical protein